MGGHALVRNHYASGHDVLTLAPLPTWSDLLRALLRRAPVDADLAAPWRREGEVAGLLSRSAWSLALIVLWRARSDGATPVRVWIPDFFCNAPLAIVRMTGASVIPYPLTADLAPDLGACRALAEEAPPDVFVLVHYFGRPAPVAAARDLCARHGAWLVEDAAHVLRPVAGIGSFGDFVLYSLHKHLPIPDGAVLVARHDGPAHIGAAGMASLGPPDRWPSELDQLRRRFGRPGASTRVRAGVWLTKRVLQKLGVRRWYRSRVPFPEPTAAQSLDSASLGVPTASGLTRRLLAGAIKDLGTVARRRQRHQLLWDAVLLNDETSRSDDLNAAERPGARTWTPYMSAYRADPGTAETTYSRWQDDGLPVTTWPDLMPEVAGRRDQYSNAWALRHSRLYLAVHQSLRASEVARSVQRRGGPLGGEPFLRVAWDSADRTQWEQWMDQVGRSNLLQSWAYGEAKAAHEGWRVRRAVFYDDHEAVALVQMLQKRRTGPLRLARINRGPLFLRACSIPEMRSVWRELARLGDFWRGRVLAIAPELSLSGSSLALMEELGFRQRSPWAWESMWVDLGLELSALRQRLDGKWRNMLTSAEKSGLQLDAGGDNQSFEWMMARYLELMQTRGFRGPPVGLLLELRRHTGRSNPLVVLRALHEGKLVAGICLACHGSAATYLLGWNGPQGRTLRANHFLLWQALVHLKHLGLRWLDLGGIDSEHTAGISAFKLGLNGVPYELVGEYSKW